MSNKLAIGIDLGTYNSCAAFAGDAQHISIIKSQYGPTPQGQVFPSFVRFDNSGNAIAFGEEARAQMAINPDLVVWGIKRLIGRSYRQIEKEVKRFAYSLECGTDGNVVINVGNKKFSPAQISTQVLKWIKNSAETFNPLITGQVSKAVITHPAYFDASQIEQTKEAAMRAGFEEVELIAEPVAAAIAYGLQLNTSTPNFIMAIDWGAGTLDIVVVLLKTGGSGKPVIVEAKPARGDVALGGIDMDDLLLMRTVETFGFDDFKPLLAQSTRRFLSDDFSEILGAGDVPKEVKDLLNDLGNMESLSNGKATLDRERWADFYKLRLWLEQAKIELSQVPATRGYITYQGKTILLKMARTRKDCLDNDKNWIILEEVLQPLLDSFKKQVKFALQKSGLDSRDIQHILLVGGPMHMPCVRKVIWDVFRDNPSVRRELDEIDANDFPVNPMEAVARGAALYANHAGPDPTIKRIPFDYGFLVGSQGEILIHDGDVVPCDASFTGEIIVKGPPGSEITIGLYKCAVEPEGELFTQMGDYKFVAATNPREEKRFLPQLQADSDKTISLEIRDLISGDALQLKRLSTLIGKKIPKPLSFPRVDAAPIPSQTSGFPIQEGPKMQYVRPEAVSSKRQAALSAVKQAQYALRQNATVQANGRLKKELETKIVALESAMKTIPQEGPVEERLYQQLANRCTELIAFMETEKLIGEENKYL
ncbi:MAG: Hsp70 family protein [Pelolinea sp.]|nr:Hsp70 family protein [Pelolinea sp.]